MEPAVKKDILSVLKQVIPAMRKYDTASVIELSNHVIHDASTYQDTDSISIAVMIYALGKMMDRCKEKGMDMSPLINIVEKLQASLERDKFGDYNINMSKVFESVKKMDDKLSLYVEEVLMKAKIKKGSKIHEHGLSVARTAELMGVSQWDLMSYVGNIPTTYEKENISVKERLQTARSLFK